MESSLREPLVRVTLWTGMRTLLWSSIVQPNTVTSSALLEILDQILPESASRQLTRALQPVCTVLFRSIHIMVKQVKRESNTTLMLPWSMVQQSFITFLQELRKTSLQKSWNTWQRIQISLVWKSAADMRESSNMLIKEFCAGVVMMTNVMIPNGNTVAMESLVLLVTCSQVSWED